MTDSILPSIWVADFRSKLDFDQFLSEHQPELALMMEIDNRMLRDRHPFWLKAWCAVCDDMTSMLMTWHHASIDSAGSVHPAWTEINACERCGLNSRMRALYSALTHRFAIPQGAAIYMAEATTPAYQAIKHRYANTVGSEYLGADHVAGEEVFQASLGIAVRHEDLTGLSFDSHSFDVVITQDVFEHIPDFQRALSECARILKPGGRLLFTIPFFPMQAETGIRAQLDAEGKIIHHLPPELHGDPVTGAGILCFQNFGWSLLNALKVAGFQDCIAHHYWGPWSGHMGGHFFVFSGIPG